jgi:hypothetical protein
MEFRDNIPGYQPPDRSAWEQQHGVAPYSHGRVRDAYVTRALAAIRKDYSSIEADPVISSQVALDHVCQRVHADSNLPEEDSVFFDPSGEEFWVYSRLA